MTITISARKLVTVVVVGALVAAFVAAERRGDTKSPNGPAPSLSQLQLVAVTATGAWVSVSGWNGGGSTDSHHLGQAEVTRVTSGLVAAISTSSTGAGAGKVKPDDVVITKSLDGYTTQFAKAASAGTNLRTVTISFSKQAGDLPADFLKYTLSGVTVHTDRLNLPVGSTTEVVGLHAASMKIVYTPTSDSGQTSAPFTYCFDFKNNRAC